MTNLLKSAQHSINLQAEALSELSKSLDESFVNYCKQLSQSSKPLIIAGLGKSGFIAKKIAATLTSVGIKSIYLHPTEALHGDIGIVENNSFCLLLSKSGKTQELMDLLKQLKIRDCHIACITQSHQTPLAQKSDYSLSIHTSKESDPLNMVPSISTTCSLCLGDCIASTIMHLKQTQSHDFYINHSSGTLGHLLMPVKQVMHPIFLKHCISKNANINKIKEQLTLNPLGAVCVTNNKKELLGLITDGDIRRLKSSDDINTALDIMTANPITIGENTCLQDALELMQNRKSEIAILPVVNQKKVLGLIRLHDIIGKLK